MVKMMEALILMIIVIAISTFFIVRKNYLESKKNVEERAYMITGADMSESSSMWDVEKSGPKGDLLGEGIDDMHFPTLYDSSDLSGNP